MSAQNQKTTLKIHLDGRTMTDITAFYEQINAQLMQDEDWKLGESLDAFDDLLYGGYSKWKDYDQLKIVWKDIAISERRLGMEATKSYYESKLGPDSSYNQDLVKEKLKQLKEGKGQTYFEILLEIIESHPDTVKIEKC